MGSYRHSLQTNAHTQYYKQLCKERGDVRKRELSVKTLSTNSSEKPRDWHSHKAATPTVGRLTISINTETLPTF